MAQSLKSAAKHVVLLTTTIGVLSVLLAACGGDDEEPSAAPTGAQSAAAAAAGSGDGSTVGVKMTGRPGQYKYDPSEFTFKVGQTVAFTLTGDSDTHTFTVNDLDIDEFIAQNETRDFTFTFSQAGTFKLQCIPHPEMTGTITVQ